MNFAVQKVWRTCCFNWDVFHCVNRDAAKFYSRKKINRVQLIEYNSCGASRRKYEDEKHVAKQSSQKSKQNAHRI